MQMSPVDTRLLDDDARRMQPPQAPNVNPVPVAPPLATLPMTGKWGGIGQMAQRMGMQPPQAPNTNPVAPGGVIPPRIAPPQAPNMTGAMQGFGPGNDLRYQQINPDQQGPQHDAERLGAIRSGPLGGYGAVGTQFNPEHEGERTSAIRGSGPLGGYGAVGTQFTPQHAAARMAAAQQGDISGGPGIGAGSYDTSGEATRARGLGMQALESMFGGPNRGELASRNLALFDKESAPALNQQFTEVGRRAAALGRLGSGMTTSNLGDIFSAHQDKRNNLMERLSLGAADQELNDRGARLGAAQGFGGQLRGEDLGEAGFKQGLRSEARGERGYGYGVARDNREDSYRRAGMLGDLDREEYGRATDRSAEARGERGFNLGLDQYNRDDSYRRADALGRMDMERYGRATDRSAEQRGERGFNLNLDQYNQETGFRRAGMLGDMDREGYNRRATARDEMRGEREYQGGMERQSYGRSQDAQSRSMEQLRMMLGWGMGSDPTAAMLAAAEGGGGGNGWEQILAESMRARAAR